MTENLRLVGADRGEASPHRSLTEPPGLAAYGDEAADVTRLPGANHAVAPNATEAMVRFAARHEYARTVEDVLARRSRLLFLDARAALAAAPTVAAILHQETGVDPRLAAFEATAAGYVLSARPID